MQTILKGNPAQGVFGRLRVGHAPIKSGAFELTAPCGVLLAHLLCCRTANDNAITPGKTIGQFLQVVARQEFVLLAHSASTGLVAEVPDGIDLTSHRSKHAGVFVFDAQFEGLYRLLHVL